tara:strand:- start:23456 stop:23878 length:423 start_codon:yes stop_codon:yes gene_type:complete
MNAINKFESLEQALPEDIIAISKMLYQKISSNRIADSKQKKEWLMQLRVDLDLFEVKPKNYINKSAIKRLKVVAEEVILKNDDLKIHTLGMLSKRKFDQNKKTIKVDVSVHKKFSSIKEKGGFENASDLLNELVQYYINR